MLKSKRLVPLIVLIWVFVANFALAQQIDAELKSLQTQLASVNIEEKGKLLTELVKAARQNHPDKAIIYAQQALEYFKQYPDDLKKSEVLSNMAWAKAALGLYDDAMDFAEQAYMLADNGDDQQGIYVALSMLGIIEWRRSNYDSAVKFFLNAIEIAEQQGNKRGVANSLNYLAIIYSTRGENEKALEHFLRYLKYNQESGNLAGAAIAMNNVAGIYGNYGNYSLALEYQLGSLKIREQINDLPGVAEVSGNIGITYFHLLNDKLALEHFKRSITIYSELEDKLGIAENENNLGKLYQRQRDFNSALVHYLKTLELARIIDDKALIARALVNLASIYRALNQLQQARTMIELGLAQATALGTKSLLAHALYQKAQIQLQSEFLEAAQVSTNNSMEIALKLNEKFLIRDNYQLLSNIYQKQANSVLALKAFKDFKSVNDEIFNAESNRRVALLQFHFAAEKKEQQIKLLEADKTLQESLLEQQIFERNAWFAGLSLIFLIILQVFYRYHQRKVNLTLTENIRSQRELIQAIAHEFRAPLARVQLAFDLLTEDFPEQRQGGKLANKINRGLAELESLIKEALDFIRSKNSQQPMNMTHLAPDKLIEEIFEAQRLLYPDKIFTVKCQVDESVKVKADRRQLERALDNLIRNAARFAKQTVSVRYLHLAKSFRIIIEDDGPGISELNRKKIFDPFVRLDPSRSRDSGGIGIGLALVKEISKRHGGQVSVSDSPSGGALFVLEWPL